MSKISLIAAMTKENRVIGVQNALPPWKASGDLKRFQRLTEGKVVLMGTNTYRSLGKPLPRRWNVVVSTSLPVQEGITVVRSLKEGLEVAEVLNPEGEIMIIGGGMIYAEALPLATCLYITEIKAEFEGDVFFPELDENSWSLIASEDYETHTFLVYHRR